MQKHFFYFPIREFTKSTTNAIKHINRLADNHQNFSLLFDPDCPERLRVHSCKGAIPRTSFYLCEKYAKVEQQILKLNRLLAKNPVVRAVGISSEICITVVC